MCSILKKNNEKSTLVSLCTTLSEKKCVFRSAHLRFIEFMVSYICINCFGNSCLWFVEGDQHILNAETR